MRPRPTASRKPTQSEAVTADAIERAILDYLRARPQARDTVEGIHRWWIRGAAWPLQQTEAAVASLVKRGRLAKYQISAAILYGLPSSSTKS